MTPVGVLAVDHREPGLRAARSVVSATPGFARVAEARSAEEALEAAVRLRPQLALVAPDLPGIDGAETRRRIAEAAPGTVAVLVPDDGRGALTPTRLRLLWDYHRPD